MSDNDGTHIRAFLEHLAGQPEITRLVLHVYPLSPQQASDVSIVMRDAATEYLKKIGVTSGVVTDVLNRGEEH